MHAYDKGASNGNRKAQAEACARAHTTAARMKRRAAAAAEAADGGYER